MPVVKSMGSVALGQANAAVAQVADQKERIQQVRPSEAVQLVYHQHVELAGGRVAQHLLELRSPVVLPADPLIPVGVGDLPAALGSDEGAILAVLRLDGVAETLFVAGKSLIEPDPRIG